MFYVSFNFRWLPGKQMVNPPSSPELWELAVAAMADQKISEQAARRFLGMCLVHWHEKDVREAALVALGKVDFKSYMKAVLSRKAPRKPPKQVQSMLIAEQAPPAAPEVARAKIAEAKALLRKSG